MNPFPLIGRTLTVVHTLDRRNEVCEFGESHSIPQVILKRITVVAAEEKMIPFLNYDSPGIGTVYTAWDAQGRVYTRTPSFDHPGNWRCGGRTFEALDRMPTRVVRDVTGRLHVCRPQRKP